MSSPSQPVPVVSLRSVDFFREKASILADITFDIGAGELVCLLGPSGSGKTTLLRIISGLNKPTRGRVEISGADQASIPPYNRDIGFVFQDPNALLPHLSVFQNVAFPLRVRGKTPRNEPVSVLVNRALEAVGLTALANRMPKQLSGGERQRVALARALVYEPAILLFDEPLASLDNISKEHLLHYISELRKTSQFSCLYVTHDEREAFRLADRVGILANGRLQQLAAPRSLLSDPITASIAKLTGAWNLVAVNYDLATRTIILPEGAVPKSLALTSAPVRNNELQLGFSVRAVELANGSPVNPDRYITLPGIVKYLYIQNQMMLVTVQMQGSLVQIQCDPNAKIPTLDTPVTCLVHRDSIKQFTE